MEYIKWENFAKVIDKAMLDCKNSGYGIIEHFPEVRKTIKMPNHYEVGTKVRKAIEDIGGTLLEDLPIPEKSIKQV